MKKTLLKLAPLTLIFTLTGCMSPAGVAVTGAQAVYNRHSIQQSFNDQYISLQAERALYLDTQRFKNTNVSVAAFNNVVLLAGQIPSAKQKNEVENIVRKIPGVGKIYNLTTIENPVSPLIRASDSWITAKIKTQLIAANDVDPTQIKVVTENGTVYLMGIVTHEAANTAVNIARTTQGVQSVVKIFSYITISRS